MSSNKPEFSIGQEVWFITRADLLDPNRHWQILNGHIRNIFTSMSGSFIFHDYTIRDRDTGRYYNSSHSGVRLFSRSSDARAELQRIDRVPGR